MRFLESDADIPDELIREVNQGRVTFLCGAGISIRVGLPSFKKLTKQVYQHLGEKFENEPAERRAFSRGEFDRVLRSLEKRILLPKGGSPVRAAVANALAPPDVELRDHLALIRLSRDSEGRPRLLTTNFDTLFERAARLGDFESVPSRTGKALPGPGRENDYGILHLHGRIADESLKLESSDLILTSADFGDAYLRDGWAARYIEDRMRLGVLVLVGYAAEDGALRLLLEALDADRTRFADLKAIYAIDKCAADSRSVWEAKGIIPIEFDGFDQIYATLAEWARYAIDPKSYRDNRVAEILNHSRQGPAPK